MNINLHPNSGRPIYQQIVEAVQTSIRTGELPAGYKLPTVRDLAEEMGIARGTIKHAYDELGKMGLIEMTQGRGTFVLPQEEPEFASRKEHAMAAIDHMLDQLEGLGFPPREIEIFLELKLRERSERYSHVRIAAVDCNPEALSLIAEQLSHVRDVDVYRFLLDDVLHSPYQLGENVDLIITTSNHFSELESMVSDVNKVARMVLSPAPHTVVELAKLGKDQRIGILSASEKFGYIIRKGCINLVGRERRMESKLFGSGPLDLFVADKDALVLPPDYLAFCDGKEAGVIQHFARNHPVIPYEYMIDAGSFMYLEERIETLRRMS